MSPPPERSGSGWSTRWRDAATSCRQWLRRRRHPGGDEESETRKAALLEGLFRALAAETAQLKPLAKEIEQRFLAIGANLEELPAASDQLVRQSQKLLLLASGREEGESLLQSTATRLQRPLRFVDQYGETTGRLHGQLSEALSGIDRMLRHEANLNRTVAPLKFIRTLFKVESSGLDHAVQTMFVALTEDISTLQRQVSETFGEKFQILRDTRQTIATVLQELEDQAGIRNRVVGDKKAALEQVIVGLRQDLERNREKDIRLTQVTARIDQEVGKLVFGLQAQDIVSQKLEHVRSALDRLQALSAGYSEAGGAEDRGRILATFNQSGRIQQGQLLAIQEDLRGTERQLTAAVEGIEEQIAELDNGCLALKEFDRVTAGVDGLVQILLDTTAEVRGLVRTTVDNASRAHEAIRPIGGRTSNVTATMRQLSSHIRLIALNAQVQAAQLENGTGLEVLAAATASVAVEAGSISEEIAGELDRFNVEMDQLVAAFGEIREEGGAQDRDWTARSADDEQRLHSYRDATLAELELIAKSAENIRTLSGAMRGCLDLQSSIGPHLQRPHETLGRIIEESVSLLTAPPLAGLSLRPVDDAPHTYTMESERQVHEAAMAAAAAALGLAGGAASGSAAPLKPTAASAAAAEGAVDLGWDDVAPAADGVVPPPASPGATVVPPLETSAPGAEAEAGLAAHLTGLARPSEPAAGETKKEFGDNVDLF